MSSSEDLKDPPRPRKRLSRWLAKTLPSAAPGDTPTPSKWSLGILNDKETVEVPGSVLLLASNRNEPLGLRNVHARTSHSSVPTGFPVDVPLSPGGSRPLSRSSPHPQQGSREPGQVVEKKKTEDGTIILEPQPDDSVNDPLNWPAWRRDSALLSLGFYCMIGGGITPLIAAGFTDVAHDYDVEVETVSLTTGLYMLGLGLGSVIASPTAILFGKRPVYLASAIIFILTCLWAAWSPTFSSLLVARVFQGAAVSPVECLPSATIAEIFFLHERAYRIGIYTLLLLGGKNLVPLVSAAIISRFGWRWVFWIVAMIVALCFFLLLFFVPETFWDRTPTRKPSSRPGFLRRLSSHLPGHHPPTSAANTVAAGQDERPLSSGTGSRQRQSSLGGLGPEAKNGDVAGSPVTTPSPIASPHRHVEWAPPSEAAKPNEMAADAARNDSHLGEGHGQEVRSGATESLPPVEVSAAAAAEAHLPPAAAPVSPGTDGLWSPCLDRAADGSQLDPEKTSLSGPGVRPSAQGYTHKLRQQPAQTFVQQLRPFHGRLNMDKWLKVMVRPFVLFAYPAVLWSAAVYACSIGWLIVISETMAIIYRDPAGYNFSALQTGLVYLAPFIGGILGTGVAGKISDVVVRAMSRRNGGLYEPEFRLVMAGPVLVTTCIGLMGFGWSAQKGDHWMVPTSFFGILSFGCSLGSTTSITFCVDSYRQYAGEALVTLNFSKNVLHGMVFSLFVAHWMADQGPRMVYIWLGIIQLLLLLFTVPLYIYGKRLRMWTVRKNLMEKF